MTSYEARLLLVNIARRNRDKKEVVSNQAPWIKPLWLATTLGSDGYGSFYCAAGLCWAMREWLKNPDVLKHLRKTESAAEKWRCKYASVFKDPPHTWHDWAKLKKLTILPKKCILHMGDIVIYTYSHIEIVTDDDNTENGPYIALGYNTNESGSANGDGCYEKPRTRGKVKEFIRILP